MTELYCGRGFELNRQYGGLLWFSSQGPLTILSTSSLRWRLCSFEEHLDPFLICVKQSAYHRLHLKFVQAEEIEKLEEWGDNLLHISYQSFLNLRRVRNVQRGLDGFLSTDTFNA